MVHHGKVLDLEITGFNYQHELTYTGEFMPSQTSKPEACRDYKNFR